MLALLSACTIVACSDDSTTDNAGDNIENPGNNNGDDNPATPGKFVDPASLDRTKGQATYNDELIDIQSVIYNTEEVPGSTVFYLSTAVCGTVDEVYEAGDFIRIVVGKTDGDGLNNNFGSESDNMVEYVKTAARATAGAVFCIDGSNAANYRITTVRTLLDTPTVADIEVTIAARDGSEQLAVRYYRECKRWPERIDDQADGLCTIVNEAVYLGMIEGTDADEYILLVSSSPITQTTDGSMVMEDREGYAMLIAFLAYPDASNKLILKDGNYKYSVNGEAGTYMSTSYLCIFSKPEGSDQIMERRPFNGDIAVSTSNGITTIRAYYLDDQGRRRMVAFEGNIGQFMNYSSSSSYLPQMAEDVDFKAVSGDGVYYGRFGEEAYGTFELVLCGEGYNQDAAGNRTNNSYAATLMLTNPNLFSTEKELKANLKKLEGQYYSSHTFTKYWTWFIPVEMNVYGMIYPYGTYVHKYDGSYYGLFGYAQEGVIDLKVDDDGTFHVAFEFKSLSNNTMKGTYDGKVEWLWQPVAADKDDGTSTLTADYDLNDPENPRNIDRLTEARLVTPESIYIQGIGSCLMSDYPTKYGSQSISKNDDIGYQYIAFGNINSNTDEFGTGDHVFIELITAPGEEHVLKAGHYTISQERWPAHFHPMNSEGEGVAVKGIILNGVPYTSHWQHHFWSTSETSDFGMSIMDGHAFFYGGEVTITGPDANGDYTFEMDFTCVRKHHIRGTWTGKVTGATIAETAALADSWHAPMLLPGQSQSAAPAVRQWPLLPFEADALGELPQARTVDAYIPTVFNGLFNNVNR